MAWGDSTVAALCEQGEYPARSERPPTSNDVVGRDPDCTRQPLGRGDPGEALRRIGDGRTAEQIPRGLGLITAAPQSQILRTLIRQTALSTRQIQGRGPFADLLFKQNS